MKEAEEGQHHTKFTTCLYTSLRWVTFPKPPRPMPIRNVVSLGASLRQDLWLLWRALYIRQRSLGTQAK